MRLVLVTDLTFENQPFQSFPIIVNAEMIVQVWRCGGPGGTTSVGVRLADGRSIRVSESDWQRLRHEDTVAGLAADPEYRSLGHGYAPQDDASPICLLTGLP